MSILPSWVLAARYWPFSLRARAQCSVLDVFSSVSTLSMVSLVVDAGCSGTAFTRDVASLTPDTAFVALPYSELATEAYARGHFAIEACADVVAPQRMYFFERLDQWIGMLVFSGICMDHLTLCTLGLNGRGARSG